MCKYDWFKGSYRLSRSGIAFNEAGAGPIFVISFLAKFIYLCFWTPWIAPRLYVSKDAVDLSFNP